MKAYKYNNKLKTISACDNSGSAMSTKIWKSRHETDVYILYLFVVNTKKMYFYETQSQ